MTQRKVLIIGCGFAGSALALFLRKADIEAVVYEARKASDLDAGAFLYLAPNGMKILKALGLDQGLAEKGIPTTGIRFYNSRGKAIGALDNQADLERYGARGLVLKRKTIFKALHLELEQQGIPTYFGQRVSAVAASSAGVQALFEDGSSATGDVLIGADGINSSVRKMVLPKAPQPSYTGLIDTGGFAYIPELYSLSGPQHMIFGHQAFFGYVVKPSGEIYWFSNVPWKREPSSTELAGLSAESWKELLLSLHRDDPDPITQIIEATPAEGIGRWPSRDMPSLPNWYQGRIGLIGDAAHATSPSAGQGASLALEDALVLGKCLRDIAEPRQAFQAFQQMRKKRVDAVVQQSRRIGNRKIPNPVMGWFRDWMLPTFLKVGTSATSQLYSYKVDWSESAIP